MVKQIIHFTELFMYIKNNKNEIYFASFLKNNSGPHGQILTTQREFCVINKVNIVFIKLNNLILISRGVRDEQHSKSSQPQRSKGQSPSSEKKNNNDKK